MKMRHAVDLNKGVLGRGDPLELWAEGVSYVPDRAFLESGVNILSACSGQCTEAIVAAKRMLALSTSKEDVNNSIYLIDKYAMFTNLAKDEYGFKNVITGDFLKWEPDMKFKVIMFNPPFNGENDTNKNKEWQKHVKKSFALLLPDAYAVFVAPRSIVTGREPNIQRDLEKNSFILYKEIAADVFGVGQSLCFLVYQSSPATDNFKTKFVFEDGTEIVKKYESGSNIRPTIKDDIIEKFINSGHSKYRYERDYQSMSLLSDVETKTHNIRVRCDNKQGNLTRKYRYSDKRFSDLGRFKLCVHCWRPFRISEENLFITKDDTSTSHYYFSFDSEADAKKLQSLWGTKKIFLYLGKHWVNTKMVSHWGTQDSLPILDLTIDWTDKMLYKEFNLTKDEVAEIEKWYEKEHKNK